MYSDKKNVLQLVALLRAHGVRRAVVVSRKPQCAVGTGFCHVRRF